MKRFLCAGLLGLNIALSATGQGHVLFSNYLTAPYNQIVWPNFSPVNVQTVQVQIWWAEGIVLTPESLYPGVVTTVDPALRWTSGSFGYGGWFLPVVQLLPGWEQGDTFTFQLRAYLPGFGNVGSSVLWTEQASIVSTSVSASFTQILPALVFTVPEPSTGALLAFGMGGFFAAVRRRQSVC